MKTLRRGFTLTEMLVVVAIIVILSGLVFGVLSFVWRKAKRDQTQMTFQLISNALEEYDRDHHDFPPSSLGGAVDPTGMEGAELLYAYLSTPDIHGKCYLTPTQALPTCDPGNLGRPKLCDAWKRPIRYQHHADYRNRAPNRQTFRLISAGPNGVFEDGAPESDDVVNWEKENP